MKFTIEWHENCLRNQAAYLLRIKGEQDRAKRELMEALARHQFYATQIEKAKQMKKDGFDRDRFMKRKEKT